MAILQKTATLRFSPSTHPPSLQPFAISKASGQAIFAESKMAGQGIQGYFFGIVFPDIVNNLNDMFRFFAIPVSDGTVQGQIRYMNQSLIDYLIDFRVDESKKLLQFTDHSIAEIADETGFSTINNFIAQFKKRTDLTPTAYRRQNHVTASCSHPLENQLNSRLMTGSYNK